MTAVQPPAPAEHPAAGAGPLTLGSLCTGYGGLDLAVAQVLDVAPAWVADPDPGAAQILAHHWPDVPNLGDITALDWTAVPPVDVLAAGFPCQDISYAGKRAGIKPGTRSGLWGEVLRAIVCLRPRLVFLENVAAILSGGWDDEPNDRCVCGWPRGRGGMHQHPLPQEQRGLHDQGGHRDDGQGKGPAGHAPAGVRRPGGAVPRGDGPLGGGVRLEHSRLGGRQVPGAGRPVPALEVRAGDDRSEGRGDSAVAVRAVGPCAVDGGGPGALRDAQAEDARAEPQGAGEGPELGAWDADCPACGRPLGDGSSRPVFRSGLGRVLGDLAAVGLTAEWTCLRASDVGAPHRRERWFLLAWPAAHPADLGRERGRLARGRRPGPADGGVPAADAARDGRDEGRPEPTRQLRRSDVALRRDAAADPDRAGGEAYGRRSRTWDAGRHEPLVGGGTDWGDYAPAIRRWERVTGRPAPAPTEPGRTGPRLSPAFVEWLMGLPAGHVTAVPGLSRSAQLKALGNGVVPQQGSRALAHLIARIEAAA